MKVGALYLDGGEWRFSVWAPLQGSISLKVTSPESILIPMDRDKRGYWCTETPLSSDSRYFFTLDGGANRPDPASNYQPDGVHGPSQVIERSYPWRDLGWRGIPLEEMIIYELHVGTITPEGTFQAIIPKLTDLLDLGVNALEVMPVSQFPGGRNWGYDGVYPFAVQNSYGGPEGFKKLIDACHGLDMSVILDVVYNHLGPEGNYLPEFGPYFTDKFKTAWGSAMNFDGPFSDEVRNFFIENALYWLEDFHVDALRLDAIHAIYDPSAKPFLQELAETVEALPGRKRYLIAESDLNDVRVINSRDKGGYGIDAQWCDDFHHSLHALLTGERSGYYQDFGSMENLAKAYQDGFVYSWKYSTFRRKHFGSSSAGLPGGRFIVFSENHDHVGNRLYGERMASLVTFEALKLAAGAVILSPYIPLIFMGQEYAEDAPFAYFVDHSDETLVQSVRDGRKKEFKCEGDPPDPKDPQTFLQSKIVWEKRDEGHHKALLDLYRELIRLRKAYPALSNLSKENLTASLEGNVLIIRRKHSRSDVTAVMNFAKEDTSISLDLQGKTGVKIIDSSDRSWRGPGSFTPDCILKIEKIDIRPLCFVLYELL